MASCRAPPTDFADWPPLWKVRRVRRLLRNFQDLPVLHAAAAPQTKTAACLLPACLQVTELTPEETESTTGGYGKAISHVIIGLKTVKGVKQLKLDPTIYDSLLKEKVLVGDVIYVEANSGAVKRVGRCDAYATEFDLEAEEYVPLPKGEVHKKKEIVQVRRGAPGASSGRRCPGRAPFDGRWCSQESAENCLGNPVRPSELPFRWRVYLQDLAMGLSSLQLTGTLHLGQRAANM
jgi:hypothetical protein